MLQQTPAATLPQQFQGNNQSHYAWERVHFKPSLGQELKPGPDYFKENRNEA